MTLVPNLHYDFNFSRFHICPNVIYTFAHICQADEKAGPSSSSSPVCQGKKAKKNCRKELPVKIVAADQASACSFLGINCSLVGNQEDKNKCRQSRVWPWTCKISCHRSHISEKAWINRKKTWMHDRFLTGYEISKNTNQDSIWTKWSETLWFFHVCFPMFLVN